MKVVCTLTREQASLYQAAVDETMRKIESSEGIQRRGLVLALITALKQICNHPAHYLGEAGPLAGRSGKLARLHEMLEEVVDAGDRALVFTQFREMGDRLVAALADSLGAEVPFLHGGVARAARDAMVQRFQDDAAGPQIFVLSVKAGGTGLNLTAANHVFHFDRWWNPAVEDQATDRAYRIGQTTSVQVHKLLTAGTIEEKVDSCSTRSATSPRASSARASSGSPSSTTARCGISSRSRPTPSSPARSPTATSRTAPRRRPQRRARAAGSRRPRRARGCTGEPPRPASEARAQAPAAGAGHQGQGDRRDLVGPALDRGARALLVQLPEPARARAHLRARGARARPRGEAGAGHRARHRLARYALQGHAAHRPARRPGPGSGRSARWRSRPSSPPSCSPGTCPRRSTTRSGPAAGASSRRRRRISQTHCSCPDWANPCKHVAAAHYVLGEAFDKDPFLLFELRGRGKDDVLGALRKRRARAGGVAEPAGAPAASAAAIPTVSLAGRDPGEFERRRGHSGHLHFRIEPPAATASSLRQLGAPPAWSLDESPAELLAPVYQAAGALARDLALRPAEEEAAGALSRAGRKR